MKIRYNSIKVRSIKESLEFYQKIFNMELVDEYYSDTLSVVMLTDGYMKLELIEEETCEYGLNNIGFTVDNLHDVVEKLEKERIELDKEDYSTMKCISLKDPDGTSINIIEE